MNETAVVRWLLVALVATIGFLWSDMNTRVHKLEDFASMGNRCTSIDCRSLDQRITRLEEQVRLKHLSNLQSTGVGGVEQ